MACQYELLLSILFLLCLRTSPQRLQHSQTQALQQLRKQLEYPRELDPWNNMKDLCIVPPSPSLTLTCEYSIVTGLKIVGDRLVGSSQYDSHPLPNSTLSQDFSINSLVTTLTRLSSLKVVILVSLGIWGPLPDKIHRLHALEVLNLSSNYIYGLVPPNIARMGMLQTLVLDANFFNGTVPDWFPSLSNLTVLSLKNNRLQGPLPKTIGAIRTLNTLVLSSNKISGELPDLSGLISLEVLDLRENDIDSSLPVFPVGLITVLLSRNSFKEEIPSQLGKLNRLQHFDLSYNLLEGHLPAELFSLPNISYLNLAANMLSGSLPKGLTCSSQLGFIDISSNRFTGSLPSCLDPSSNKRVVKLSNNCLVVGSTHQHEAAYCTEAKQKRSDSEGQNRWTLVGVIAGVFVFVFLLVALVMIFCVKKVCHRGGEEQTLSRRQEADGSSMGLSTELLANARFISERQKLGMQLLPLCRQYTLEELQEATKNFGPSSYIGEGSMGKLYKGRLENGSYVVVRCLSMFKRDSVRNLKLRLDLLSKLRHPHLVCLLGHCIYSPGNSYSVKRVLLVYEYVPNGNLRDLLSANNNTERTVQWSNRLEILIGIAKAVHFLHTGVIPGFFNNRLKTSSVLLDEHYFPKVSDYGLSIITEEIDRHEGKIDGQKSSHADQRRSANLDDDVYRLGFILLEMLVGPSIIEKQEAFFVTKMAAASANQEELKHMLEPMVLNTSSQVSLSIVISITSKCVSPDPSFRPSIEDVLWNLRYAEQVHTSAQRDQRSDASKA